MSTPYKITQYKEFVGATRRHSLWGLLLRLYLFQLDTSPRLIVSTRPVSSSREHRSQDPPVVLDQLLYSPLLALDVAPLFLGRQSLNPLERGDGGSELSR